MVEDMDDKSKICMLKICRMAVIALGLLVVAGCSNLGGGGRPLPASPDEIDLEPDEVQRFDFSDDSDPSRMQEPEKGPYRLGIGDVIEVSIYGHEGTARQVPIDPKGRISYMLVGSIKAVGKTIPELREEIQKAVDEEYNFGIVNVVPKKFGSQQYTILGQVNSPGTYPLKGNSTIVSSICAADGLRSGYFRNSTIDLYDLEHAALIRDGRALPVDFKALVYGGDSSLNVELQDGDIIHIPSALQEKVYVLGEVNFPRSLGFYGSISLLQALAEVRGVAESAGDKVVLVRGSLSKPKAYTIDYRKILAGETRDIMLRPDDIVYVPKPDAGLLREMVRDAINSFVSSTASESADELYRRGRPDAELEERPVLID